MHLDVKELQRVLSQGFPGAVAPTPIVLHTISIDSFISPHPFHQEPWALGRE